MPLLPIVERDLRIGARQPATYRVRFWPAAAVLAIGGLMVLSSSSSNPPHMLAQNLFSAYGTLALAYTLFSGLFLTADCLSSERREQTLGLLFLTDLKGYDVVLGKLAATSMQSVYALLGLVPVIAMPLLMGGITGGAVVRLALTLLVTMFFSLATGMLVSALSREARQAILGTLGLLIGICGILPLIYFLVFVFRKAEPTLFLYPCPVYTLFTGFDDFYRSPALREGYWRSLFVVFGMAVVFLAWACFLSPRLLQEKVSEKKGATSASLGIWRYGTQIWRKRLRALLPSNPVYWLLRRDKLMSRLCWLCIGTLLALCLFLFVFIMATKSPPGGSTLARVRNEAMVVLIFASFGMHLIFKCLVAIEASRRISDDAHSGALELLATTPIANHQFIEGFRQAMARQFFLPKFCMCVANFVVAFVIVILDPVGMHNEKAIFFWCFFFGGFLLFSDYFALKWTSLRLALTGRRHHRVILGTLGRVMLPAWISMFLFFFIMASSGGGQNAAAVMISIGLLMFLFLGIVQGFLSRALVRDQGFRDIYSEGQMKSTMAPVSQTENRTWNMENAKAGLVVKS